MRRERSEERDEERSLELLWSMHDWAEDIPGDQEAPGPRNPWGQSDVAQERRKSPKTKLNLAVREFMGKNKGAVEE